ncbi:hypothetical protein [Galbibacter sp. PAP.153]|uniref:hypothetical protein n=1 Tax=Galbibacter sp. PAP.153 TaxID=3104623 RepID=UPI003009EEE6
MCIKYKISLSSILLAILLVSCKNKTSEADSGNNKSIKVERTDIQSSEIIKRLQGSWKEAEYPFRKVEFKNSTVKFTEEGLSEAPRFKAFKIYAECPFDNNNIQNVKPTDTIISITEDKHCEKLKISNNTLTLSGYNATTKSDYEMEYKKQNK